MESVVAVSVTQWITLCALCSEPMGVGDDVPTHPMRHSPVAHVADVIHVTDVAHAGGRLVLTVQERRWCWDRTRGRSPLCYCWQMAWHVVVLPGPRRSFGKAESPIYGPHEQAEHRNWDSRKHLLSHPRSHVWFSSGWVHCASLGYINGWLSFTHFIPKV